MHCDFLLLLEKQFIFHSFFLRKALFLRKFPSTYEIYYFTFNLILIYSIIYQANDLILDMNLEKMKGNISTF